MYLNLYVFKFKEYKDKLCFLLPPNSNLLISISPTKSYKTNNAYINTGGRIHVFVYFHVKKNKLNKKIIYCNNDLLLY
jgi:hypothetical protein